MRWFFSRTELFFVYFYVIYIYSLTKVNSSHLEFNVSMFTEKRSRRSNVIGIHPVRVEEHPYHACVVEVSDKNTIVSEGAIITEKAIITSAHQFFEEAVDERFLVIAGIDVWNIMQAHSREVSKVIIHPEYMSQVISNDVAVILIKLQFSFNEKVKPVKITLGNAFAEQNYVLTFWMAEGTDASPLKSLSTTNGRRDTIVASADTPSKNPAQKLFALSIYMYTYETCEDIHKELFREFERHLQMCGKGNNCSGMLTCLNALGSPLILDNILYGITSRGSFLCTDYNGCIYTNVHYYHKWISKSVSGAYSHVLKLQPMILLVYLFDILFGVNGFWLYRKDFI